MGLIRKEDIHESLLNSLSNPNLLINGDFQVWQRGTSFSGNFNNKYAADRWKIHYFGSMGTFNSTISKTQNGLRIINNIDSECNLWITQTMEDIDYNKLKGKTVTVQVKITDNTTSSVILLIGNGEYMTFTSEPLSSANGIITLTVTIPQNITDMRISVYGTAGQNKGYTVEWIKLEYGSVATPFIPRLYAEELALCQRYYERVRNYKLLANIIYAPSSTKFFRFVLPYSYKRVVPTIELSDISKYRVYYEAITDGTGRNSPINSVDSCDKGNTSAVLKVKATNGVSNDCYVQLQPNSESAWIDVDAEIY